MTQGVAVIHEGPGASIKLRFWRDGKYEDVDVTRYTASLLADLSRALSSNLKEK